MSLLFFWAIVVIVPQCQAQTYPDKYNITAVLIGPVGGSANSEWKDDNLRDLNFCGRSLVDNLPPSPNPKRRFEVSKTYCDADHSSYIINGREATATAWPWQVLLKSLKTGKNCGGSLIAPDLILSSAQCYTDGYSTKQSIGIGDSAFMGRSDRAYTRPDQFAQNRSIVALAYPREYVTLMEQYHDYVVYRVEPPFELNDHVNLICLSDLVGLPREQLLDKMRSDPSPIRCVITGFGVQNKDDVWDEKWPMDGPLSNTYKLQQANVGAFDCRYTIAFGCRDNSCVCVRGANQERPCLGDLGSPLVCLQTEINRWTLVGHSSFDDLCNGYVSAYIDLTFFKDGVLRLIRAMRGESPARMATPLRCHHNMRRLNRF